ncbi:HAUS3 protein, partial [Climacteris rufus]|nr:HAUS3 protein [Climacteris rufus]
ANRAADFMATLRLIYPHADTLCEEDFEWLFDCPETKQFLEWFCSTVGEENMLSPAEVEAYEALLAAGKPILEGNALEEALQMCCHTPRGHSRIQGAEKPSPEALQQKLQELKDYRDRQLWRYRTLLAWTEKLRREQRYLEEEEKVVKQDVRMAHMDLKVKIFNTRAVLSQVSKAAKQVSECPRNTGVGQLPTLMCQTDLGPYLEQEQQATDAFERFFEQVLPGTVQAPDAWEANGSQEVTERTDTKKTSTPTSLGTDEDEQLEDQDSYWKEMGRIETAHICARREVIVTAAEVEGNRAALEWAQRTLAALQDNQQAVEAELWGQAGTLQTQLHALRFDITQTLTHQLLPLLKAEARRSCLPILLKHLSLEDARLQNMARRQEEAAAWLLSQQSRLDLVEFQLERERKELEQMVAWLEKVETVTRESQSRLQKQENYFKDARSSQKGHSCKWIDPKDHTALRLWNMLMGKGQEKQPFHSYEAMEAKCSQLIQDKKAMDAQLTAPMPQLSALESTTKMLYQQLYNSSNQLQLSSPEITTLMQQSIIMQDELSQKLTDLLSDLEGKRRSLQNPILQAERNLYVYFYCNKDRLREVVEELEKQASAASK